jgi:hypothetical protein
MPCDPEEIVTLFGHGQMTLRMAVQKIMKMLPSDRAGSTIFRMGEQSILDRSAIERLAGEWGVRLWE